MEKLEIPTDLMTLKAIFGRKQNTADFTVNEENIGLADEQRKLDKVIKQSYRGEFENENFKMEDRKLNIFEELLTDSNKLDAQKAKLDCNSQCAIIGLDSEPEFKTAVDKFYCDSKSITNQILKDLLDSKKDCIYDPHASECSDNKIQDENEKRHNERNRRKSWTSNDGTEFWDIEGADVKCPTAQNESGLFPSYSYLRESFRRVYFDTGLLHKIQTFDLFADSKTFVDMPMKFDAVGVVLEAFDDLANNDQITWGEMERFIHDYFEDVGNDLEAWIPEDWTANPPLISEMDPPSVYSAFASNLNEIWKTLGRRITPQVEEHPTRHTLLWMPHPFIIPGDRFREFYYWDTYWTIKGLMVCGMQESAKRMITNFMYLVETYGFVPNGGRVYYLNRSQPSLLIPMVEEYYKHTKDLEFLRANYPTMEKEHDFWINYRTVPIVKDGKCHNLARYIVHNMEPRPEGYTEDLHIAHEEFEEKDRKKFYQEVAAGAESGMDYSSRWFAWEGPDRNTYKTIKTSEIIPVDLNTFLCWSEVLLAHFASLLGLEEKQKQYEEEARSRWDAMNELMWDEKDGVWYDYDIGLHCRRNAFFPTNVIPLLLQSKGSCNVIKINDKTSKRVLRYLQREGGLYYPCGVPASKEETGQQWDFPNAWAPLTSLIVDALDSCNFKEAKKAANRLAKQWVETVYSGYCRECHMYEKYDATDADGIPGEGGEYRVQIGFGWTNGVTLELLQKYYNQWTYQGLTITLK